MTSGFTYLASIVFPYSREVLPIFFWRKAVLISVNTTVTYIVPCSICNSHKGKIKKKTNEKYDLMYDFIYQPVSKFSCTLKSCTKRSQISQQCYQHFWTSQHLIKRLPLMSIKSTHISFQELKKCISQEKLSLSIMGLFNLKTVQIYDLMFYYIIFSLGRILGIWTVKQH